MSTATQSTASWETAVVSARRPRWDIALPAILVLGLAIRLLAVLLRPDLKAAGDALFYHQEANFLVDGRGWTNPLQILGGRPGRPTAAFPPLFTVVLSIASLVGFKSFFAHRIWCALIGTAAVGLAAGTGRSIGGRRVSLLAAGLVAVYPNLWMSDDLAMSETLSPVLVLGVLWAAYAFWRNARVSRAVLLGALLGLAVLGRDELAMLAPLLALPLALGRERPWRERLRYVVAVAFAATLVVGPWVGYNLSRFDRPVFVSDGLGVTLASANCDRTWYGANAGYWSLPCSAAVPYQSGADESVQGAEAQHHAVAYVRAHLGGLPRIEVIRLGRAFGVYRPIQQINYDSFLEGRPRPWALAGLTMYYVLVPLAVTGAVLLRRRRLPIYPMMAVVLGVVATVLLAFGQTRYRSALEPVLVLLAAVALDTLFARRSARGRGSSAAHRAADEGTLAFPPAAGPFEGRTPVEKGSPVRNHDVLVVMPALNEEQSVAAVVYEVRAAMPHAEVLVVDDGSGDATAVLARAAGARVASSPFTLGVGGAMRIGFCYARLRGFRALVQVDADGQHDPADVPTLLAAIRDGDQPQMAIGARFAGARQVPVSWPRRLAMRALAAHVSHRTGVRLEDVTSGFRAYNRTAIELFARHYPAEYLSDTVESIVIAHAAGASIVQVPVTMRARVGGSPSQSTFRAVTYLARVGFILVLALLRRKRSRPTEEDLWQVSI